MTYVQATHCYVRVIYSDGIVFIFADTFDLWTLDPLGYAFLNLNFYGNTSRPLLPLLSGCASILLFDACNLDSYCNT